MASSPVRTVVRCHRGTNTRTEPFNVYLSTLIVMLEHGRSIAIPQVFRSRRDNYACSRKEQASRKYSHIAPIVDLSRLWRNDFDRSRPHVPASCKEEKFQPEVAGNWDRSHPLYSLANRNRDT